MAEAVKDAAQAVVDAVTGSGSTDAPKLLLDEVTGERVSKSELKKRQRQRENEKKKAEKAAAAPPKPAAKKKETAEDEEQLNPNQYFEIRSRAVKKLRDSQDPKPYPHEVQTDNRILPNFHDAYGDLQLREEYVYTSRTAAKKEDDVENTSDVPNPFSPPPTDLSIELYESVAGSIEMKVEEYVQWRDGKEITPSTKNSYGVKGDYEVLKDELVKDDAGNTAIYQKIINDGNEDCERYRPNHLAPKTAPHLTLLEDQGKTVEFVKHVKTIKIAEGTPIETRGTYIHSGDVLDGTALIRNIYGKELRFEKTGTGIKRPAQKIRVGARIYTKRSSGANLIFYDIRSLGTTIQVMCQKQYAEGDVPFADQHEHLQRGDIIEIVGYPGRTDPKSRHREGKEGELSIFATQIRLLTPCLHLLPGTRKDSRFDNLEERHRKKHLDLIMNDHVRKTFVTRARIVTYLRNYFDKEGFIEVETPMMNQIAGGATARPFKTFHNDLDMDLYMRIAPELFLKELIVGGMEKVYEIGRQFRNEGIDLTHNPEFTTLEFYEAFADYQVMMDRTERLVSSLVHYITGGYETTFKTQHGEVYNVNWKAPWKKVHMMDTLDEKISAKMGEKIPDRENLHDEKTNEFLRRVLKEFGFDCSPPLTNARMLDTLVGEFIEEECINPTFIMGHPQMMSPLAKYHRLEKGLCERFEAFVCKKEIVNAYTELNDPFDQRLRFEEQARQKAQGDDEAQLIDEVFCEALEYGLPPTGGFGMGIDRLVMFLTNNYTIKEVLTFPMMRPDHQQPAPTAAEITNVVPIPTEGMPHK